MASSEGGTKAKVALIANLGIAASKFVAFAFTGSASMLAESIRASVPAARMIYIEPDVATTRG